MSANVYVQHAPPTRHAVHHHQSSIGDTQGSCHLRGEVDVAWGVDEVDEEARTVLALLDEVQVVLRQFIEEGDGAAGETEKSSQPS